MVPQSSEFDPQSGCEPAFLRRFTLGRNGYQMLPGFH